VRALEEKETAMIADVTIRPRFVAAAAMAVVVNVLIVWGCVAAALVH
jgi:hypothetical protein